MQLFANAHEPASAARIEHGRGFIEDEDLRFHGQDARDRNTLLLAAGKRVGLALLEAGQANLCKCRFNALAQFWIGDAKVLRAECHIVFD